ncbi:hypothetical protein FRX31_004225 [Thalictrum thalictroides]|uniref:Uncharacterized protein n=1 Tax=Thalictrum thalictroides TaxID=46969 RepID=A0A7J6XB91_THATH|nr:hypothetical protein FRX31_004225 [Thalictrum thalictroides]
MKLPKEKHKAWNRNNFGRVDSLIKAKATEINDIDLREETVGLSEDEIVYREVLMLSSVTCRVKRRYLGDKNPELDGEFKEDQTNLLEVDFAKE